MFLLASCNISRIQFVINILFCFQSIPSFNIKRLHYIMLHVLNRLQIFRIIIARICASYSSYYQVKDTCNSSRNVDSFIDLSLEKTKFGNANLRNICDSSTFSPNLLLYDKCNFFSSARNPL